MVFLVLTLGIDAIQLGSTTALNALLGGAVIRGTTTYIIVITLALCRGSSYLTSDRWLGLGWRGTAIRAVAMTWCAFVSVWLCFPLYLPVTLGTMNWASVVFVGVVLYLDEQRSVQSHLQYADVMTPWR